MGSLLAGSLSLTPATDSTSKTFAGLPKVKAISSK
jgi:hypothetical protein